MTPALEYGAVAAIACLVWLLWLLLFERGTSYRTSGAIDCLSDIDRLYRLTALIATPVQSIESLELLHQGPSMYERQLSAIRSAQRSVHLEAYIFRPGRYATAYLAALKERAQSGVRVRVVVDAIGSLQTPRAFFRELVDVGGEVHQYHPLRLQTLRRWNSRTHRNLLVIDGTSAFIGGAGVADHWARSDPPPWRDCIVMVRGEIVDGLQAVFAENWLECAGELLVDANVFAVHGPAPSIAKGVAIGSTPTAGGSTRARTVVQFLLASASHTIDLCSPYFVPDLGIRRELIAARARGVRIRVLTGGPYSDHGIVRRAGRRRYGSLLSAGIAIHEYALHMLHVKALIVDGRWSLVGSANIDHRSFGLNDEVNLLVADAAFAGELQRSFEHDLIGSELLDLAAWQRRSVGERLLATVGRVIERHQ